MRTRSYAAAVDAGADALHPGFGFLAESAPFAEAVIAAGIRWVGPPPEAIRQMGDKAAARRLAVRLGVPVLPGYDDADQSDEALSAAARRIGLPVLVKPAAGGGGKGMRIVRDMDRLGDALAAGRREATAAFGDGRLILERFLEGPRHVEIQVLFDAFGNGVHLGERDCSIQRRHQKVLEETPSPGRRPSAAPDRLGEAALALASAVGYVGAGTCEFLVDDRGEPVFLEMNTRLQVEHPVTELVTGRDLVEDQLRIAAGEPLGFGQADVTAAGHAVEVRLYAEDAEAGFLPATGRIEELRWPSGPGIRVDAGRGARRRGHGPVRPDAGQGHRARRDARRGAGSPDGSPGRHARPRAHDEPPLPALARPRAGGARRRGAHRHAGADLAAGRLGGADRAARRGVGGSGRGVGRKRGRHRCRRPVARRLAAQRGAHHPPRGRRPAADRPAGANLRMPLFRIVVVGDTVHVDVAGLSVPFRIAAPPDVTRAAREAAAHTGGPVELVAPMPGVVLAVEVALGEAVAAGEAVVTLEAMKMEHGVVAPIAGRLAELRVAAGDQVTRGQVLGVVEP